MHKSIFFLLFFCVISSTSFAQHGGREMDVATFFRDSGKVQVEIYYSVPQSTLGFQQRGDGWVTQIDARAELIQDGKVIGSVDIKKEKTYHGTQATLDSAKNSVLLDGVALWAKANTTIEAILIFHTKDGSGVAKSDTIGKKITIDAQTKDKFYFGGVELANKLVPSDGHENLFEKVGYVITPNPSDLYSPDNSKLNYYSELSVPSGSVNASTTVDVVARVLDGQKHEMFANSRSQSLSATMIPLIGSIDIDGLPSDQYFLELVIKRAGVVEATTQKKFFYNDGMTLSEEKPDAQSNAVLDEKALFAESDLSRISQLELEEKGDQAVYIGTTQQAKAWKKLKEKSALDASSESPDPSKSTGTASLDEDIVQERRFLFDFWRAKDKEFGASTPLTAYKQYYKRVDDANRKFTTQKTPGWETDFGRVYLTYGAPEERMIKSEMHSIDSKPYIVWQYDNKRIPIVSSSRSSTEATSFIINYNYPTFVFVDKHGGGKFLLVHSNVQGEVYDTDWYIQDASRTTH